MKKSPIVNRASGSFVATENEDGQWIQLGNLYPKPGSYAFPDSRSGLGPLQHADLVFDIGTGDGWIYTATAGPSDEMIWSRIVEIRSETLDVITRLGNRIACRNIATKYGMKSPL